MIKQDQESYADGDWKKTDVQILISDKTKFKTKKYTSQKGTSDTSEKKNNYMYLQNKSSIKDK